MQHTLHAEGFGVRLRPVRMEDAAFIVWLRNLDHVKGRVGDSAMDAAAAGSLVKAYFDRQGDYYFIIETLGGIRRRRLRHLRCGGRQCGIGSLDYPS